MKKYVFIIILAALLLNMSPDLSQAAGISVDAGLTPAESRWIVRAQMRYMQTERESMTGEDRMKMYGFPVMAAYGVRNYFMLMVRQTVMSRDMTMMGSQSSNSGLGDLFVLAKYKAYRINTPAYTIGIAPTLGISIPSGNDDFTSDTWDINLGAYLSGRSGRWASDFNISYLWNDPFGGSAGDLNPGDEFSLDWAGAYQISLNSMASSSIAPVAEASYKKILADKLDGSSLDNTGEEMFQLSFGAKYSMPFLIIEGLIQVPVSQDTGSGFERDIGLITGIRVLI